MAKKNYYNDLLPGEPIILSGCYAEFSVAEDQPLTDAETRGILDQAGEPLYLIIDLTEVSLSLNDIIVGANIGARSNVPLWKHPNLKEVIFVVSNATVKLAIKGLDSMPFGNIQAKAFGTQKEALDYCRTRIAEGY